MQCLTDAPAGSKSRQNRIPGNVRMPTTQVLREARGRYELPKLQIRVINEGRLILTAQIIRVRVNDICDARMPDQISIRIAQVLTSNACSIKTRVRTTI